MGRRLGALCVLSAVVATATAQDGAFDDRFGNYLPGRTVHQLRPGSLEDAYAVAMLPDDGIIFAGSYQAIRLGPSGLPDPDFGENGVLRLTPYDPDGQLGPYLVITSVHRQNDGKLILAGSVARPDGFPQWRLAACRTDADGRIDSSFGDNGCKIYVVEPNLESSQSFGAAAALDSSERLVMLAESDGTFGKKMVAIRLDRQGRIDLDFGTNGKTVILRFAEILGLDSRDEPRAMTIDPAGRILVVGSAGPANVYDFAVARLGPDGRLDGSFGNGGAVIVDFHDQQRTDFATAVAVQGNGRIIVAGVVQTSNFAGSACGFLGLTSAGALDTNFGSGGSTGKFATYPFGLGQTHTCMDIVVYPDQRFALVGYGSNPANNDRPGMDMWIQRFTARGDDYDQGFAEMGTRKIGFDFGTEDNNTSRDDRLNAVTLDSRQRLVAVGSARGNWPNSSTVAIRLTQDGLFANGFELQ